MSSNVPSANSNEATNFDGELLTGVEATGAWLGFSLGGQVGALHEMSETMQNTPESILGAEPIPEVRAVETIGGLTPYVLTGTALGLLSAHVVRRIVGRFIS